MKSRSLEPLMRSIDGTSMTKRFVGLMIVAGLSYLAWSCSLLLDLEQCESERDCPAVSQCIDGLCQEAQRISVTDHIVEDTTWTSDNTYVLENLIMVIEPATLTIEAGTTILGRRNTGLVSLAGARLEAEGTRDEPIVFTSDKPPGQRVAGDWAGVAMVGKARTNRENFYLRIVTDEYDTRVGGEDDSWNCGTMRYVRIEFGGSEIDGQKALNGLTLAGCGRETTVEYVQTHMSDDDGVAVFGGTVDLRYIVSTRANDDGFDFDTGWRGTAQFIAVQQDINGVEAIELENLAEDPSALPQTNGRIYNYTLIGADRQGDRQIGLFVKYGGLGMFSHGIVMGHKSAGLYIDGDRSAAHAENELIGVEHTLFYDIGDDGTGYFQMVDDGVDDETGETWHPFTNYEYFEQPEFGNLFGLDPGFQGDPYDLSDPAWVPSAEHTTSHELPPPPAGFDPTGVYRGAFNPNATPWTEGWTAYPLH